MRTKASFTSIKRPCGVGEINPFLDVVEQFAIALLGFAAVGDVFEHVDGLHLGAGGGVNARSRNQIGAIENVVYEFVESVAVSGRMGRNGRTIRLRKDLRGRACSRQSAGPEQCRQNRPADD